MGRYFSLSCYSKSNNTYYTITSYWKAGAPSIQEIKSIGKKLNWNMSDDLILTGCYDTVYVYNPHKDNYDDITDNWFEKPESRVCCNKETVYVNYRVKYNVKYNITGIYNEFEDETENKFDNLIELIKDEQNVFF
jgi:hypothetical protein